MHKCLCTIYKSVFLFGCWSQFVAFSHYMYTFLSWFFNTVFDLCIQFEHCFCFYNDFSFPALLCVLNEYIPMYQNYWICADIWIRKIRILTTYKRKLYSMNRFIVIIVSNDEQNPHQNMEFPQNDSLSMPLDIIIFPHFHNTHEFYRL